MHWNWKRWPYWLRGGAIGGGTALIYLVLLYTCPGGGFGCLIFFYVIGPVYPVAWLMTLVSPVFNYGDAFAEAYAPIVSVPFWFVLGSIIGLVVGYVKSKKRIAAAIVTVSILVVFLALYALVLKSKPSIISISPQESRVGNTISIAVSGIGHEGYSRVHLVEYGKPGEGHRTRGELWVGKIPDSNIISFALKEKNCLTSSCDFLVEATPGDYKLRVSGSNPKNSDSVLIESDFKIIP
ncbi:MAG: hypothetical protein HYY10_03975 [Candidatus Liptonbacteria bacterium]|nr:hypothetical protein [Candidatus Liptonbacteria bacterium]